MPHACHCWRSLLSRAWMWSEICPPRHTNQASDSSRVWSSIASLLVSRRRTHSSPKVFGGKASVRRTASPLRGLVILRGFLSLGHIHPGTCFGLIRALSAKPFAQNFFARLPAWCTVRVSTPQEVRVPSLDS